MCVILARGVFMPGEPDMSSRLDQIYLLYSDEETISISIVGNGKEVIENMK